MVNKYQMIVMYGKQSLSWFKGLFLGILVLTVLVAPTMAQPMKVGEEVLERYETTHPYMGTGETVWEKTFHWPRASYISLHFERFDLAPGDFVEISDPARMTVVRYEGKGKMVRGGAEVLSTFWAQHIRGDTVSVRLYTGSATDGWGFVIDKWVHGYEVDVLERALEGTQEAICGTDDKQWAPCYSGTEKYNKSRTVARLLIQGSSLCTGWLLGSAGHLMTNNHCISTQTAANNTDYEFMAEGATCSTSCPQMTCPGTVAATFGTMVQTNATLDFTLILLPTNLSTTYGYLQLRSALPSVGEQIYIPQHPAGKGKQLAVNDTQSGPGYCHVDTTSASPCAGGPGDIGYMCDTEGGSSGSPVLSATDNLVVALHHCGGCEYEGNLGVPIPSIITALGSNLPPNAVSVVTSRLLWTQSGQAVVWKINASGAYYSSQAFAPGSTWTATSYHDLGDGNARILWTRAGEAVLWTVNSAGTLLGYWSWAPGSTWTASSYYPMPDGTSRILWTKPGSAVLWTVNGTGSLLGYWTWAPGSTWIATGYQPISGGNSRVLWTRAGEAVLWTVNNVGTMLGYWSWGPGSTWTATGYQPMSDGTSRVLWTRSGTAVLWTVNTVGTMTGYWSWAPGSTWTAQSYYASSSAGGAFQAETFGTPDLVVKKAGDGQGTIVAGEQTCGPTCQELRIPYRQDTMATLQVVPEAGSIFARWETAAGVMLEQIYYAQPGDTVIAVFEQK